MKEWSQRLEHPEQLRHDLDVFRVRGGDDDGFKIGVEGREHHLQWAQAPSGAMTLAEE